MNLFSKKFDTNRFDTLVGQSMSIKGDLFYNGSVHIHGSVHGNVVEPVGARIEESSVSVFGKCFGSVSSDLVVVSGEVEGSITALHIHIKKSGRVYGPIKYNTLVIDNGGLIEGSLTLINKDYFSPQK